MNLELPGPEPSALEAGAVQAQRQQRPRTRAAALGGVSIGWAPSELDLSSSQLTAGKLIARLPSRHLRSLVKLDLKCNSLGPEACAVLAGKRMPELQELVLTSNPLTDAGLEALQPLLGPGASVRVLGLTKTRLTDSSARLLAKALEAGLRLERLLLGFNGIGDLGAAALGAAGLSPTGLVELNLGSNRITDSGCGSLASCLEASPGPPLLALDLSSNHISGDGMAALWRAVRNNGTITELRLGNQRSAQSRSSRHAVGVRTASMRSIGKLVARNKACVVSKIKAAGSQARQLIATGEKAHAEKAAQSAWEAKQLNWGGPDGLRWEPRDGDASAPPNACVELGRMEEYSTLDTVVLPGDGSALAHSSVLFEQTKFAKALLLPSHSGFSLRIPQFSRNVCGIVLDWIYYHTIPTAEQLASHAGELRALAHYLGIQDLVDVCAGTMASATLDSRGRPACLRHNQVEVLSALQWLGKVEKDHVLGTGWSGARNRPVRARSSAK